MTASPSAHTTPATTLTGQQLIAGQSVTGVGPAIHPIDPASDERLDPVYHYGTLDDVVAATTAAAHAFPAYRATTSEQRARFLESIADHIEASSEPIIARASAESGLPLARITGEVGRTTGQLHLFAGVLREGSWNGSRIDPAQPERTPLPRPDIRQRKIPLGPVAVFGASNFPLAFSVAGGDTASALAAGCPVVVKGHDAHLGTSELVARAITAAVAETQMPAGTFSLLFGDGPDLGIALVTDPRITAVGFTGSRTGGMALVAAAAARPEPVPVYAEMSSVNPVYPLPGALAERADELAAGFVGSLAMGSGQYCTNPGLVIAIDGPHLDHFISAAAQALSQTSAAPMLTGNIARQYASGVERLSESAATEARGQSADGPNVCRPALFSTDAATFLASPALQQEVFGSSSIVVKCTDAQQVSAVAEALEGQLTATIHTADSDLPRAGELMEQLELKAGRVIFDGWPTGVEVGHAMVHGGPTPATSDSRTTSVGSLAIERFLRPVAYQNVPPALLPSPIANGNPDGLWRRVDGELTRD